MIADARARDLAHVAPDNVTVVGHSPVKATRISHASVGQRRGGKRDRVRTRVHRFLVRRDAKATHRPAERTIRDPLPSYGAGRDILRVNNDSRAEPSRQALDFEGTDWIDAMPDAECLEIFWLYVDPPEPFLASYPPELLGAAMRRALREVAARQL